MKSFGPTLDELDKLRRIPVDHLAEAVDVAFAELMASMHQCAAVAGIDPQVTFGWLMAQIADVNPHWATALGKMGYVNFPRGNPHIGARFVDTAKLFGRQATQ